MWGARICEGLRRGEHNIIIIVALIIIFLPANDLIIVIVIREDINRKKTFSFG